MPTGKPERKEGESSGDDSKKRTASPSLDDDGSDSTDSRRSRRKKPRVCSLSTQYHMTIDLLKVKP